MPTNKCFTTLQSFLGNEMSYVLNNFDKKRFTVVLEPSKVYQVQTKSAYYARYSLRLTYINGLANQYSFFSGTFKRQKKLNITVFTDLWYSLL